MMIVFAGVTDGVSRMAQSNRTIVNRSDMHAAVRNATELLRQEVEQAGRISLPGHVTTTIAVAIGPGAVTVSSTVAGKATAGIFVGEKLGIDTGAAREIVEVTAFNDTQITATFENAHPANVIVESVGGFAAGVIPTTIANGSTGSVLKILGDINDDGRVVYVEYTCDVAGGRLYRNSMAFDVEAKVPVTEEQVLLDNIQPNPGGTNCFTYQQRAVVGTTYAVGVAIMVTVRTQKRDPVTNAFQNETKALLNVSPRNVFTVWQMAGLNQTDHIQPIPIPTVGLLRD